MYIKDKNQNAKIIISLNFRGIEEGLNPDVTKFDIQKLKSPIVIMSAIESLEFANTEITTDVN